MLDKNKLVSIATQNSLDKYKKNINDLSNEELIEVVAHMVEQSVTIDAIEKATKRRDWLRGK